MSQSLWLGTDKTDITPRESVPLAGFSTRSEMGGFESVAHSIYARIFFFRHSDGQGGTTSALLVSADLIWWGEERVPDLKRRIQERWGIPPAAVLLHGTHSHSGPQTSVLFSDYLGIADPAYIEWLEAEVMDGIERAAGSMEQVTASYGSGECFVSVNRRLMVDGSASYRANPDGPLDRLLRIVRFRTGSGLDKGILVHYACHPVITQENRISSEFCGVAMDQIERALGDTAVSAYLQGFCGDINPVGTDGELILEGYDSEVARIGGELAEQALRVLSGEMKELAPCPLSAVVRTVAAPLQHVPTLEELQALTEESWVTGDWSRKLLASPERLRPDIPLRLVSLTLAEGVSLLAANAEIVAEYGLYLQELAPGRQVLGLGYTNGMIGYIPTAAQIAEGGYESFWSTPYFLLPSPFDPEVEEKVRSGLKDIIREGNAM
ncbi:neutral/alkaline non-lysosomal ceramidase N-terminal domain-containing protein [Paenibacillaceae bacterium WGS1546]|uniref:neutral/alkaline non-lysosomal ceramidase N-terminal domain-containing protein n=1 Tax=Cohnella sp. WGS1546 TaxID=3366810 RepID=UPI00372D0063